MDKIATKGMAIVTMIAQNDPRLEPRYSIAEASRYLWVNAATLATWVRGRFYQTSAGKQRFHPVFGHGEEHQLTFLNLMEAHVFAALRRTHRLPMKTIRKTIHWLSKELQTEQPLLHPELAVQGTQILIDHMGDLISASEEGQKLFRAIVEKHLSRIHRDKSGLPAKFFPFTRGPEQADAPRLIVLDPRVADGRPVIQGTRISPSIILERFDAGEDPAALAKDYDLELKAVHEAIRSKYERKAA